jgi:TfoX N-terminal domain
VAYEEKLANRLRELLGEEEEGIVEKKMFGGLAFLLNGNMSVSASGRGGLLVRVDPEESEALLARPHVAPMEMRGRTMTGWLIVAPEGVKTKRELAAWVNRAVSYAKTLPPK